MCLRLFPDVYTYTYKYKIASKRCIFKWYQIAHLLNIVIYSNRC